MASESISDHEGALVERGKRFEELFYLFNDPLFENIPKFKDSMKQFSLKNNKRTLHKTIDHSLFGKNPEDIIRFMESRIDLALYTISTNKRKPQNDLNNDLKRTKLIQDISNSHKEVNTRIIEQPLEDLDVLSVPQHYPVNPHHVSSLAELYYLSQTLPLIKLLPGAHKALTTESYESALLEGKIAVLYSRIEELKRQGKWSLRQPLSHKCPVKKTTHWDYVIKEGNWMAMDFKEQVKYKKAACLNMAQAVEDYWSGKDVKIRRKEIVRMSEEEVEELLASAASAALADEAAEKAVDTVEPVESVEPAAVSAEVADPAAVPAADSADDMEVDKLDIPEPEPQQEPQPQAEDTQPTIQPPPQQPTIDTNLLLQPPQEPQTPPPPQETFTIPPKVPDHSIFKLHVDISDLQKMDQSIIRNLPKFTAFDDEEVQNVGSKPLKSSHNDIITISKLLYSPEEDEGFHKLVVKEKVNKIEPKSIPEYQKGLFGTQNHRKFNYLKPPKPPLIKNIEYRSPTIWLPRDDKLLIHYVAEFCFNWDLISEHLLSTVASMKRYESNIERRTPWQCFERYIQLNEKFQFNDMKGPYSYNAQQWLEQAHRAQSTTKRRISPLGVGNESIQRGHRRLRWASMFDSIRKCMKKRETHIAKMNSRRATDYTQQATTKNDKCPTPAELSKLKYERDKSIQEAYLNQQATRNRMMAAVAHQQKQQAQRTGSEGENTSPDAGPASQGVNAPRPPIAQGTKPTGVSPTNNMGSSSRPPSTNSPTSSHAYLQQALQNVPHDANGRPLTPNGTPYTREQLQKLIEIQKRRQMMQYQQRQGQPPSQPSSQPSQPSSQSNQLPNGQKPPMMGTRAGPPPGSSKMTGQQVPPSSGNNKPRIQFAPAQVSAIINSIKAKNPNLGKDQVTKLAASYLANLQQQQQQKLRQQQQQQPNRTGTVSGQAMNMNQRNINTKQQLASLTPQERNQLQMLKAAKNAQQQQQMMQQQQMRQSPMGSPNMSNGNSPVMGNQTMNNDLTRMEYEKRKRMLIKQQQQQQFRGSGSGSSQ